MNPTLQNSLIIQNIKLSSVALNLSSKLEVTLAFRYSAFHPYFVNTLTPFELDAPRCPVLFLTLDKAHGFPI
jgi:hypothetical protein